MFLDPVFGFALLAAKCHHTFSHLHTCHLLKGTLKVIEGHTPISSRHCRTRCKILCLAGRQETQERKERINLLTGSKGGGGGREDTSPGRNLPSVVSAWQRHTDLCCHQEAEAEVEIQVCLTQPCTPVEGRRTCIPAPPPPTRQPKTGHMGRGGSVTGCVPRMEPERPLWPLLSPEGGHLPRGRSAGAIAGRLLTTAPSAAGSKPLLGPQHR